MTNEKLAELAQDPENKELIPVLWDKVKDLLYMKANSTYRQYSGLFTRCGVELPDIRQSCYMVFLEALKGYKSDSDIKFTSYLNYPFKTMIQELTHTRTSRKEPLNDAASLDKPLQNSDGDETTLESLIPDSKTDIECYVLEQLERTEEQELVHEAVNRLPEHLKAVIEQQYFQGLTVQQIAENMGEKKSKILSYNRSAIQKLRHSPVLYQLYREYLEHIRWNQTQRLEYRPEYFEVVQQLRERQEQGEYISYGKFKAELYSVHLKAVQIAEKQLLEENII